MSFASKGKPPGNFTVWNKGKPRGKFSLVTQVDNTTHSPSPVSMTARGVPGVTVVPSSTNNSLIVPLTGETTGSAVYEKEETSA